jgi:hypothetical protein
MIVCQIFALDRTIQMPINNNETLNKTSSQDNDLSYHVDRKSQIQYASSTTDTQGNSNTQ